MVNVANCGLHLHVDTFQDHQNDGEHGVHTISSTKIDESTL